MVYVFYNDYAGKNQNKKKEVVRNMFMGEEISFNDVIKIDNKLSFLEGMTKNDKLVIMGGDGTLNHFVNSIDDREWDFPIYCYAGGTGNDFLNDTVGNDDGGIFQINDYIRFLPTVTVKGETYKYLNGVGFGIDGYACEVGDEVKSKGKNPNYTKIALGGFCGKFKTVHAKVTVDGEKYEFDNVWLAPAMNGKFYGGGMQIAPMQDRKNPEHTLTLVILTCKSALTLLPIFPSVFKGKHVKYEKYVKFFTGKEIEVEFDRPTALQIDGETVREVTSYKAYAFSKEKVKV